MELYPSSCYIGVLMKVKMAGAPSFSHSHALPPLSICLSLLCISLSPVSLFLFVSVSLFYLCLFLSCLSLSFCLSLSLCLSLSVSLSLSLSLLSAAQDINSYLLLQHCVFLLASMLHVIMTKDQSSETVSETPAKCFLIRCLGHGVSSQQ